VYHWWFKNYTNKFIFILNQTWLFPGKLGAIRSETEDMGTLLASVV